jgi:hypothetical protein
VVGIGPDILRPVSVEFSCEFHLHYIGYHIDIFNDMAAYFTNIKLCMLRDNAGETVKTYHMHAHM